MRLRWAVVIVVIVAGWGAARVVLDFSASRDARIDAILAQGR